MSALEIVLGVFLILLSVLLIAIVLMQKSREGGLSGAIAGGSDTFFGKNKGRTDISQSCFSFLLLQLPC